MTSAERSAREPRADRGSQRGRTAGRYVLYDILGTGGAATVYLGCLSGPGGFERLVAIKQLHPHLARDPDFERMLLDEARVSASIRHPAVVSTIDVFSEDGQLYLVMDYVHGEPLSALFRALVAQQLQLPTSVVVRIGIDILEGLHAAHTAADLQGTALGIVHRDVSPQNVILGVDGRARVADFGVAKARGRLHTTDQGNVKGKAAYMAPEQLRAEAIDHRVDVFAAAVVLWELLSGERLFAGGDPMITMLMALEKSVPSPSTVRSDVGAELSAVILRALERDASKRYPTAHDMALALEAALTPASHREVGDWVRRLRGLELEQRASTAKELEATMRVAKAAAKSENTASDDASTVELVASGRSASAVSSESAPMDRPRTTERVLLLLLTVGVVFIVRLEWSRFSQRSDAASPPPVAGANTTPILDDHARSLGTPAQSEPDDPAAHAASPVPSSEAPPARSGGTSSPVVRPNPHAPRASGSPQNVRCKPPYTVDSAGIRIPKPECLPH